MCFTCYIVTFYDSVWISFSPQFYDFLLSLSYNRLKLNHFFLNEYVFNCINCITNLPVWIIIFPVLLLSSIKFLENIRMKYKVAGCNPQITIEFKDLIVCFFPVYVSNFFVFNDKHLEISTIKSWYPKNKKLCLFGCCLKNHWHEWSTYRKLELMQFCFVYVILWYDLDIQLN